MAMQCAPTNALTDYLKVGSVLGGFAIVAVLTVLIALGQIGAFDSTNTDTLRAETFAESIAVCHTVFADNPGALRQCVEASLATDWAK